MQGIINGLGSPTCNAYGTTLIIGKFTEIIINQRFSSYRIKIEVFHGGWSLSAYGSPTIDGAASLSWGADVLMWAGPLARASNWYIFWSTLNAYNSYFSHY